MVFSIMSFRENLRDELSYQGIIIKELSEKTGIPKRTLDSYVNRDRTPSAEIAVKIARALNVTVEFLVTGKGTSPISMEKYVGLRRVMDDLLSLPPEILSVMETMIHAAASTTNNN